MIRRFELESELEARFGFFAAAKAKFDGGPITPALAVIFFAERGTQTLFCFFEIPRVELENALRVVVFSGVTRRGCLRS